MENRNYGIDMLKILTMFIILLGHFLGRGGVYFNSAVLSANYNIAWLMEIPTASAVACFAIISGYLMIERKIKAKQLLRLWFEVFFYSVVITVIFAIMYPETIENTTWIKAFFPVTFNRYWYFTAYFITFLFMPIINAAYEKIERKILENVLLILFIMLSVIPTFSLRDSFYLNNGHSPWMLIYFYMIGGYIKKYKLECSISQIKAILSAIGLWILIWLMRLGIVFMFQKEDYADYLHFINSPFMIFAAILLFIGCCQIKFPERGTKLVEKLSEMSFAVYLIHVHPLVFEYLLTGAFTSVSQYTVWKMTAIMLVSTLGVFICCLIMMLGSKGILPPTLIRTSSCFALPKF